MPNGFRHLLIGYDFALGKGREGNAKPSPRSGFSGATVEIIPCWVMRAGNLSTEIRKLSQPVSVCGRSLLRHPISLVQLFQVTGVAGPGIPLPNIDYPRKILPLNGIYACWAWLMTAPSGPSTLACGRFHPDALTPLVEATSWTLIGGCTADLRLDFVQRLRDEMRFPSVAALIEQIQRDVTSTREILTTAAAG
jgi:riboflavin kinase/FMN adenylyltransferase